MKKLNLNLAYALSKADEKADVLDLTAAWLTSGINMKYPNGLEGQLRRQFGRIQRKFDDAILNRQDMIELEDSEFELLNKSFQEAKFPSIVSKYINVLEDEMERVAKS